MKPFWKTYDSFQTVNLFEIVNLPCQYSDTNYSNCSMGQGLVIEFSQTLHLFLQVFRASIAQPAERQSHNLKVVSSILTWGSVLVPLAQTGAYKIVFYFHILCIISFHILCIISTTKSGQWLNLPEIKSLGYAGQGQCFRRIYVGVVTPQRSPTALVTARHPLQCIRKTLG